MGQMNQLSALYNLTRCKNYQLKKDEGFVPNYVSAEGQPLEIFIKAIFCGVPGNLGSFESLGNVFAYIGNVSKPPDAMLQSQGDAIEIKKVENPKSSIFLNSSLPKTKLNSSDKMISAAAKDCERWKTRDMLYIVGYAPKGKFVKSLFFFYGDCFAKKNEFYSGKFESIKRKVSQVGGISSGGNEYGTLKNADGLGNGVNMRVRPINSVNSPWKIFEKHLTVNDEAKFSMASIMRKGKYLSFPNNDRDRLEETKAEKEFIAITDPDKPAKTIDAVIIKYEKS